MTTYVYPVRKIWRGVACSSAGIALAGIGIGIFGSPEQNPLRLFGYFFGGAAVLGLVDYLLASPERRHETLAQAERRGVEKILRDNTYAVPDLECLSLDASRYQLTDAAGKGVRAQFVGQQLVNLHHGEVRISALEQVLESVGSKGKELNANAYQVSPYQFVHGNLVFMVNYFKREDSSPSSS